VNYRTPAEIMTVAADILAEIDPGARPPRSVRDSGTAPWRLGVADPRELASVAAEATVALAAQTGDGTLAVIGPQGRLAELGAAVTAVLPEAGAGEPGAGAGAGADGPDLERPVVVLTVRQAKGLEFDSVLVADPAMILAESPRGLGDLYVALTRATQRAGVVHTGALPSVLGGLTAVGSVAEVGTASAVSAAAALVSAPATEVA
jgi:DNA helicase IV